MALSTNQLLTLLQLERIGNAKVFSMARYAVENGVSASDTTDLLDLVRICIDHKIINGTSKKGYSLDDIMSAEEQSNDILWKSDKNGVGVLSYFDQDFPEQLKTIYKEDGKGGLDNPLFLFYKGNIEGLKSHPMGIAIIGTREPTPEGVKAGHYFSKVFAEHNYNIVSGLAIGCDTTAHEGALSANGFTTAFLGNGLDTVYPSENEKLAQRILDNGGLLMSEYPVGTKPMANYFVARDRLQSGLANAVLVIQTGIKGGTMHAVNGALANNKPLFAVEYIAEVMNMEKALGNANLINKGKARTLKSSGVQEAINIIESSKAQSELFTNSLF